MSEFEKEKRFRGFAKGEVVNLDQFIGKGGVFKELYIGVFFSLLIKKTTKKTTSEKARKKRNIPPLQSNDIHYTNLFHYAQFSRQSNVSITIVYKALLGPHKRYKNITRQHDKN